MAKLEFATCHARARAREYAWENISVLHGEKCITLQIVSYRGDVVISQDIGKNVQNSHEVIEVR